MLAAARDKVMRSWILKVPTRNIGTMRLFAVSDLPFLVAFQPRRWCLNVVRLHQFQKNLTEREWASLAQVYPRSVLWVYVFQLFFWGNSCNVLSDILRCPDNCLLAEVFLSYFCQIDQLIDSSVGCRAPRNTLRQIKNNPKVRAIGTEFVQRLSALNTQEITKKSVVRLVLNYRRDALNTAKHWGENTTDCWAGVVADKEKTAGNLMYVWSRLLGYLYRVPSNLAENRSAVFFNFAMALQFIDDLSDAAEDYKVNSQNLFLAIAKKNKIEWESLRAYLDSSSRNFIDWRWLRRHAPCSYSEARKRHGTYRQNMYSYCPELAQELCNFLAALGTLVGFEPLGS